MVRLERALEGAATSHTTTGLALLRGAAVELAGTGGVVDQLLVVVVGPPLAETPEQNTGHGKDDSTTNTDSDTNDGLLVGFRQAAAGAVVAG